MTSLTELLVPMAVDSALVRMKYQSLGGDLAAQELGYKLNHPDYGFAAGIILAMEFQKNCAPTFSQAMFRLEDKLDPNFLIYVERNQDILDSIIVPERDFTYSILALRTLEKSYLLKSKDGKNQETSQYQLLREAIQLNMHEPERIKKYYKYASLKYFSAASPTKFNAGLENFMGASCFLGGMKDTRESILDGAKHIGLISSAGGGIGWDLSQLRHSSLSGGGSSHGIISWADLISTTLRAFDQRGKRKGAGTVYLQAWHVDIDIFIHLRAIGGNEDLRIRDINYCIWLDDLFLERVVKKEKWTLFCPNQAKGLWNKTGANFKRLYERYEADPSIPRVEVDAFELYAEIIKVRAEAGMPFMMSKDAANMKCNQRGLGYIANSNLCTEIIEYSDSNNIASCNLSNLCIDEFVNEDKSYNFKKLHKVTKFVHGNIERLIDVNVYCLPEIERPNLENRPMGIGVMGGAYVLQKMDICPETSEAIEIMTKIAACIYHASLQASRDAAIEKGACEGFWKTPMAQGKLQFDLWKEETEYLKTWVPDLDKYGRAAFDEPIPVREFCQTETWAELSDSLMKVGGRNTLLTAYPPTASSARIVDKTEGAFAQTRQQEIYKILAGEQVYTNPLMVKDIDEVIGWNDRVVKHIIDNNGSIQNLHKDFFTMDPRMDHIQKKYKTGFEISRKWKAQLAAAMGRYIDQSISFNDEVMGKVDVESMINRDLYNRFIGNITISYYTGTERRVLALKSSGSGCLSCE